MLMFFLFFTVLSMMQTGMQAFAATALVALHGTPLTVANLALSAFLFASAAGVLIGGEISDRWQRHDLVAGAVFVVSGVLALLARVVRSRRCPARRADDRRSASARARHGRRAT